MQLFTTKLLENCNLFWPQLRTDWSNKHMAIYLCFVNLCLFVCYGFYFYKIQPIRGAAISQITKIHFFTRIANSVKKPKLYIPSTLNIDLICSTHKWLCVQKMLNHGLNHGIFLSLFKLISCPIYWIVCVLAYLNFIFEF